MHLASSGSSVPANPHSKPTVRISTYLSINTNGGYEFALGLHLCFTIAAL